jgi:hypothetical protein
VHLSKVSWRRANEGLNEVLTEGVQLGQKERGCNESQPLPSNRVTECYFEASVSVSFEV